ncbi:MAG: methionine adenosyltransferase, partial [Clostridia bacterium]|nr:methionine adenosyltransferase [Clostridia bacterium]
MRTLFTSESVTEGHPDKICDQISDAVLDALLEQDPYSRVACETCATTGLILVMGEITTKGYVPIADIVRKVVNEIGYDRAKKGFDGESCAVLTAVHDQSPDIAQGVDDALETRSTEENETGAGDQGMMFGFACDETPEMMPMPIALAHRLTRRMAVVRKTGVCPWMRPDGKSQVTVVYEDGKPVTVDTIVISTQHDDAVTHEEIERAMIEDVIKQVIPAGLLSAETKYFINSTGRFVVGGPAGDSGLTGRKIIVDTYGGYA